MLSISDKFLPLGKRRGGGGGCLPPLLPDTQTNLKFSISVGKFQGTALLSQNIMSILFTVLLMHQINGAKSTSQMIVIFLLLKMIVTCQQLYHLGSCGIPEVAQSRVISGIDARKGSWPWQILMLYNGRTMCGGSIVAPQWVVTAAHCVSGRESNAGYFKVR